MSASRTLIGILRTRRVFALALTALTLTGAAATSSFAATPRADFADVEDEIMCDTCNVALYIAESPRADQLRTQIRDLIAEGRTKQQIKAQLKAEYGPNILAEPDKDGLGILAYVLPVAFALGLLGLMAILLPRWRRRAADPALATGFESLGPAQRPSPDDEARLDDELARYDT